MSGKKNLRYIWGFIILCLVLMITTVYFYGLSDIQGRKITGLEYQLEKAKGLIAQACHLYNEAYWTEEQGATFEGGRWFCEGNDGMWKHPAALVLGKETIPPPAPPETKSIE